jgi:shikimate kinase
MTDCVKIMIAGFSGAGKSSLLKALEASAPRMRQLRFEDLDALVLSDLRGFGSFPTLAAAIEAVGWVEFRETERSVLLEWADSPESGVLALGGGSLTMEVLQELGQRPQVKLLWLRASFEECWHRLQTPGTEERPLLKLGREALRALYEEREQIFRQIPWQVSNPEGQDLPALSQLIWARLGT